MISLEVLRRYPLFGALKDERLKAIAMVAEEKSYPNGAMIFQENCPANKLYLVIDGDIEAAPGLGVEKAIETERLHIDRRL